MTPGEEVPVEADGEFLPHLPCAIIEALPRSMQWNSMDSSRQPTCSRGSDEAAG